MARVNSLVVSARVDARDMATVMLGWLKEMGSPPRSTSELVKETVGMVADFMISKYGEEVEVRDHDRALEVLEQTGLRAHSTRSRRALSRGMQAEMGFTSAPYMARNKEMPSLAGEERPFMSGQRGPDPIIADYAKQALSSDKVKQAIARRKEQEEALDVDSPTFERDYKEKEKEKLQELKQGLATPPTVEGEEND